jgi:hypothetical protein
MAKINTKAEPVYEVLHDFLDLQDPEGHVYKAGDKYPREGISPTKERIEGLLSEDNGQKRPVIK